MSGAFNGDSQIQNGHVHTGTHHNSARNAQAIAEPPERTAPTNIHASHPAISIIVPALNEEKLIGRTLECFPQDVRTRYNIELVVSDGGSTDRTVEIAEELADIVVLHTEDRKQTIAEGRNCGAARATGNLLVFINADTVPRNTEQFLKEVYQLATADIPQKQPVAIACSVQIAPAERRISDVLFHTFFNNYVRVLNTVGLGMGRGECQIVRRDKFQAVGGYHNHMAAGEDFDLYRRLTQYGKIGYRRELLVYESPRRFRRFGYIRVLLEWTMNAVTVMVFGRSISKEWEEVR